MDSAAPEGDAVAGPDARYDALDASRGVGIDPPVETEGNDRDGVGEGGIGHVQVVSQAPETHEVADPEFALPDAGAHDVVGTTQVVVEHAERCLLLIEVGRSAERASLLLLLEDPRAVQVDDHDDLGIGQQELRTRQQQRPALVHDDVGLGDEGADRGSGAVGDDELRASGVRLAARLH